MNRAELQQLAEERELDALLLLGSGRWSGAYYLAGYAVECALKACIAKLTNLHDFPDKDFVNKSYTHKIEVLVELAGLKTQRDTDAAANPALDGNWVVLKDWDESARYKQLAENAARRMCEAVFHPTDGVLSWIKARW